MSQKNMRLYAYFIGIAIDFQWSIAMGPKTRFCLFLTGLLLLTGVAGCTTRHDQLAELGFTRNYLDGYQDGCSSRKEECQKRQRVRCFFIQIF